MLVRSSLVLLAALSALGVTRAQFTCTTSNTDEKSCLDATGDDSGHCAWCKVAGFGLCVSEDQAETMEQNLPGTECDRHSGSDDDAPATDDATPDDDNIAPSDDSLPDNFWKCLQKKDTTACTSADCTWCDSKKFGFGLCMTGPTADSASESDFFECSSTPSFLEQPAVNDPTDTACIMAYMQDPTQEGCASAMDSEGNSCEYCSVAGMGNVCLTQEQADMGSSFGVSCEEELPSPVSLLRGKSKTSAIQDPFDTACLMAFMQDPTASGCAAAVDSDGNACEFCSYQGVQLCLNEEQAEAGEQFGMECGEAANVDNDPVVEKENVDLPPDFVKCLKEYEQGDCNSSGCTWCNTEVGMGFCMAGPAARAMSECDFFSCDTAAVKEEKEKAGFALDAETSVM